MALGRGRFVMCPWQNVNVIINARLKRLASVVLHAKGLVCFLFLPKL